MTYTIREHYKRAREIGCIVSGRRDPTLHHCHGGSMRGLVYRGKSQKVSDWLVIPLDMEFHTGDWGIDAGQPWLTITEWERRFGTQANHLDMVRDLLCVDVWSLAGIER